MKSLGLSLLSPSASLPLARSRTRSFPRRRRIPSPATSRSPTAPLPSPPEAMSPRPQSVLPPSSAINTPAPMLPPRPWYQLSGCCDSFCERPCAFCRPLLGPATLTLLLLAAAWSSFLSSLLLTAVIFPIWIGLVWCVFISPDLSALVPHAAWARGVRAPQL